MQDGARIFSQEAFDIRCEWGLAGVKQFAPVSDVVVIVDVLSFSTSVDIAVANGAMVFPYNRRDARATQYAQANDAELVIHGGASPYSLSPSTLLNVPAGTRLVLPSPNGATLSLATADTPTYTACLRNAQAVAQHLRARYRAISIVPAGERWKTDNSLRPSLEDLIGAGAVIHHLEGDKSLEAETAESVYLRFKDRLAEIIRQIGSGRELIEKGLERDLALATQVNLSNAVPRLVDQAYIDQNS